MSKKRYLLGIALLSGVILLGFGCKKTDKTNTNTNSADNDTVNVNATVNTNSSANVNQNRNTSTTTTNQNTNSDRTLGTANSGSNVNAETSDDNSNTSTSSGTLKITSPSKNEKLQSPFTVEGTAPAGTVYVRVKNSSGTTLFTESTTARNGAYKILLSIQVSNSTSGKLEVYQKDGNGNETSLVSEAVTFEASDSNVVNVNSSINSNSSVNVNISVNSNSGGSNNNGYDY